MSKIETVASEVDQDERLLHDDELDAVSGGKGGQKPTEYLVIKMTDCLVSQ
jgi:hypothetical protein